MTSSLPRLSLLCALLVWGASACQVGDEISLFDDQTALEASPLHGRLAHITMVSRTPFSPDSHLTVSAQFVDFRGIEEPEVRDSLALWTELPSSGDDRCWLRPRENRSPTDRWLTARIDLLHAGTLQVQALDDHVELAPRPMPELLPYLGGVTYGTDRSDQPSYQAGGAVEIWSEGGEQVPAFDVTLALPEPIAIAYVAGAAVGSSASLDIDLPTEMVILWDPIIAGETIEIVLEEDRPEGAQAIHCTALDDGAFAVSDETVRWLSEGGQQGPLRLTLRRTLWQPIELSGFDEALAVAMTEHSLVLY